MTWVMLGEPSSLAIRRRFGVWDVLVTIGNLVIIPALLPTILNPRAYVPRLTSGMSVLGIGTVVVGLAGAGLALSPIVVGCIAVLWGFIFLRRGRAEVR